MGKVFILYDGRAKTGNTDRASVMDSASSATEARRESRTTWKGYDAVWFEYEDERDTLVNEKMRLDISPRN